MDRPTEEQIVAWYSRLVRTALRMTGSPEDAADLAQETFCRAMGHWERFDGKVLVTTWLHQILVNCVRDLKRRQAVRTSQPFDEWAAVPAGEVRPGPADQLDQRERLLRLREAILELPDSLGPAFACVILDEYSYAEAAEMLSVPPGTIASRVHQARNLVQAAMKKSFPEA